MEGGALGKEPQLGMRDKKGKRTCCRRMKKQVKREQEVEDRVMQARGRILGSRWQMVSKGMKTEQKLNLVKVELGN